MNLKVYLIDLYICLLVCQYHIAFVTILLFVRNCKVNLPTIFMSFNIVLVILSFMNFLIKVQINLPISTNKQSGALKLLH